MMPKRNATTVRMVLPKSAEIKELGITNKRPTNSTTESKNIFRVFMIKNPSYIKFISTAFGAVTYPPHINIFPTWCSGTESNRHALRREILSLLCLPFHHPSKKTFCVVFLRRRRELNPRITVLQTVALTTSPLRHSGYYSNFI